MVVTDVRVIAVEPFVDCVAVTVMGSEPFVVCVLVDTTFPLVAGVVMFEV